MSKCWEIRGCPPDMLESCPISVKGRLCVLNCQFAHCKKNEMADISAIFVDNGTRKKPKAVKQICLTCKYYVESTSKDQADSEE